MLPAPKAHPHEATLITLLPTSGLGLHEGPRALTEGSQAGRHLTLWFSTPDRMYLGSLNSSPDPR